MTANKALLAVHGAALARAAEERGVPLAFEAAVAGGIPVIKALREGLAGNRISAVAGILNGTCNYILTQMRERGREFAEVLADAQKLGYAEADPSFDIDGIDAAHKLAILAALAFGRPVAFDQVHVEGIRRISAVDIAFATELGYRIKLLGIARQTEAGIETRVHPCMVPQKRADRRRGWRVQRRGGRGRFRRPGDAGGPRGRGGTNRLRRRRRSDRHRPQPDDPGLGRVGVGAVQCAVGADEQPCRRLLPAADGGGPAGRDRGRHRDPARHGRVAEVDAAARPQPRRGGAGGAGDARDAGKCDARGTGPDRRAADGDGGTDPDPDRAGLAAAGVHAVEARAGYGEIQEDEAVEDAGVASVQHWEDAARSVGHEVGGCHVAGEDEGDGAGEEA